ncbi:MAG: peroxiredoxin family protein [Isosphaeraceae bacterium]
MMRSIALALASLVLMTCVRSTARAGGYAPEVGTRHPDFTLPRIDGRQPVSISEFRGGKVLLIQFASW